VFSFILSIFEKRPVNEPLFRLFTRRQSEDMSVLAQDYPSAPANPSSLAKRDARGFFENLKIFHFLY